MIADKIRRLTAPQRQVFKGFLINRAMTSLASAERVGFSGKKLGGIHSSLLRNGLIEPIGKNADRTLDFKITREVDTERNEIMKIIDEIETFSVGT